MTEVDSFGLRGHTDATATALPGHPLVVMGVDTTTPFTGLRLVEDGYQLAQAIENGDWASGVMAVVAGVADVVAAMVDPIGAAFAMGVGWMLEHVEPLRIILNQVTGDAGAVLGASMTWSNIARRLDDAAVEQERLLARRMEDMQSRTTDAYTTFMAAIAAHVRLQAVLANAIAKGLEVASTIVQIVHDLVRDALADCVGKFASALIQELLTLGMATPKVIADLLALVAKWTARVGQAVEALIRAFARFSHLSGQVDTILRAITQAMDWAAKPEAWASATGHRIGRNAASHIHTPTAQPLHPAPRNADTAFYADLVYENPQRPLYRDGTAVDIHLPRQGQLGDCYLIAALNALGHRSPDLLTDVVHATPKGIAVNTATRVHHMQADLPASPCHPIGLNGEGDVFGNSADGSTAMAYIEKAYAQTHGGYEGIGFSGNPGTALEWLTGDKAHDVLTTDLSVEAIHEIFDGTAPAVAGTPGLENTINAAEAERLYLIEKHAYAVIGRNEDGLLLLHNPWGDRHPKPLAVEQFQRLFTRVFWTKER